MARYANQRSMKNLLKKALIPSLVFAMTVSTMIPVAFALTPTFKVPSITIPNIKFDFSNLKIEIPKEYFSNIDVNLENDGTIYLEGDLEAPPLLY